jgi:2,4-dienoyl-CoA reductase-like NADH-dependent reductase (Old Yellow Enzyme family)
MFKSILDLGQDAVEIATAPVEIAVDLTRVATKPTADMVKQIKQNVKNMVDPDWPEDFQHDSGNYENTCKSCGRAFFGLKSRTVCKPCADL